MKACLRRHLESFKILNKLIDRYDAINSAVAINNSPFEKRQKSFNWISYNSNAFVVLRD